jgi:hypothetical protein
LRGGDFEPFSLLAGLWKACGIENLQFQFLSAIPTGFVSGLISFLLNG